MSREYTNRINVAIVSKYGIEDVYLSIREALKHAGRALSTEVRIGWLDAERFDASQLEEFDGVLIPGGFGHRGISGKIDAIHVARTKNIPFLGLCLGFQMAVVSSHGMSLGGPMRRARSSGKAAMSSHCPAGARSNWGYQARQLPDYNPRQHDGEGIIRDATRSRNGTATGTKSTRLDRGIGKGRSCLFRFMGEPDGNPRDTLTPVLLRYPVPPRIQVPPGPAGTPVPWFCKGTAGIQEQPVTGVDSMVNTSRFIDEAVREISSAAGDRKVVMALSGGVDSSVAAAIAAKAIGNRLSPLCRHRSHEERRDREDYDDIGAMNLDVVNASAEFLDALKGITDPEEKRKAIGERFIRVFEREAKRTGARFLLQGTFIPTGSRAKAGSRATTMSAACPSTWNLKA